ncbi:MAG TPA: hypothetical protein VFI28_03085 [Candidatus Limnocylindrales bacterium]|nr:hypothetical protein [Candidatus Limnocylindrales bacterium]
MRRSTAVITLAPLVAIAMVAAGGCAGKPLPIPTRPPVPVASPGSIGSGSGASGSMPAGSAAPTASPTPNAGQAAAENLRSLLGGGLSYKLAVKGDVLLTVSDLAVSGSLSVSGEDVASTLRYTFEYGEKDTIETRLVGGRQWVRTNGGAWKATKVVTTNVLNPFAGALQPGAIVDGGAKTVGGKSLRGLQIAGGRLIDLTTVPAVNLTEERVTSALLTILVDVAGRPVSGHWMQRGQGRVSGQLQEVDVDVDLTFSGVGSKVTVSAP